MNFVCGYRLQGFLPGVSSQAPAAGAIGQRDEAYRCLNLKNALVIVHLGGRVMPQGAKAARWPQRLAAGKARAGGAAPPRTRLSHR